MAILLGIDVHSRYPLPSKKLKNLLITKLPGFTIILGDIIDREKSFFHKVATTIFNYL